MIDFITDEIAIGNRHDASDLDLLREQSIAAVLNVAWDLDIVYPPHEPPRAAYPVEYHKVGMIDGEGNAPGTLAAAVLVLQQILERHPRVLVHCHAGVSRSSTVVSLFLAVRDGIPFDAAVAQVRKARWVIDPHAALVALAKQARELLEA